MGTDNIEILLTELDALFNIDLTTREIKKKKKKLTIVKIGTSGGIQSDIRLGSHLVSDYAIGLDNLFAYYDFPQDKTGLKVSKALKKTLGLNFMPYCCKCSEYLKKKIAWDMPSGNTLSAPGFYAPQGREIRLKPRNPSFLNELIYFHLNDFWLTNFEMEASAYYGLGKMLGHEVLCLNAIIANRVRKSFSKNYNVSVDKLIQVVLERI